MLLNLKSVLLRLKTLNKGRLLLILLLLGTFSRVGAQVDEGQIRNRFERDINQDQRETEQLESIRNNRIIKQQVIERSISPLDLLPTDENLPRFMIHEIVVSGNKVLSKRAFKEVIKEYEGRELNQIDIQNLAKALSNVYLLAGYSTSRVFVGPQNLTTGKLVLTAFEGKVSDVVLSDGRKHPLLISAFPRLNGRVLNVHDIDQGVDQLNRLSSQRAQVAIQPDADGHSLVVVELQVRNPYAVSLQYDNNDEVGLFPKQTTLMRDNFFGINDFFYMTYNQDGLGSSQSHSTRAFLELPLGYSTFSISYSDFQYQNEFETEFASFLSKGDSINARFELERVFNRHKYGKQSASLSLNTKKNENFINDTVSDPSSRRLSILSAQLSDTRYVGRAVWSTRYEYSRGLEAFGADVDLGDAPSDSARRQFQRHMLTLYGFIPYGALNLPVQYTQNISFQYSEDVLFGSERVFMGDRFTLRGLANSVLFGDSGGYIKQDFDFRMPQKWTPWQLSGGIGWDMGMAKEATESRYLYAATVSVGLELNKGYFTWDFRYGWPVAASDALNSGDGQLYFMFTGKII